MIAAIHGGGDWADASADYLVLPEGVDLDDQYARYRGWYEKTYLPALRAEQKCEYLTFAQWLLSRVPGARAPTDDELVVYAEV